MKSINTLLILILCINISSVGFADDTNLSKENQELRERVEKLEKELAELKKLVMQQSQVQKAQPDKPQTIQKETTIPQLSEKDVQKILSMVQKDAKEKKPVWSSLDIQLYGYIKADAAYDTSRVTTGNYVVWVDSESSNDDDDEFNLTANQTRLGMMITGPQDQDVKTSGRVEIDFYGNNAAENKAKIQMRHAYLKIDWPDDRFDIIAGQTSDVIAPLNPATLNYTVLWYCGNIGYRRPQIRLTKSYGLKNDVDLKLEGAVARTIGRTTPTSSESGEDAGYPSIQGRASLTFPWFGYKPTTIGLSGHWAREEYDTTVGSSDNKKFESWSVNFDLTQPINKWLTIKGEAFDGQNLNAYFGGIGQGVNVDTSKAIYWKEIASRGGWIAASLGPWDKYTFNVGAGMDDVDDSDLNNGDRGMNRSIFANVLYSVNKNTQIGFELSHWRTEYKGKGDADSLRAQSSFIYKF